MWAAVVVEIESVAKEGFPHSCRFRLGLSPDDVTSHMVVEREVMPGSM